MNFVKQPWAGIWAAKNLVKIFHVGKKSLERPLLHGKAYFSKLFQIFFRHFQWNSWFWKFGCSWENRQFADFLLKSYLEYFLKFHICKFFCTSLEAAILGVL